MLVKPALSFTKVMQWLTSPLNLDKSGAATWVQRFVQKLLTLCPVLNVGCKLTQGFISLSALVHLPAHTAF